MLPAPNAYAGEVQQIRNKERSKRKLEDALMAETAMLDDVVGEVNSRFDRGKGRVTIARCVIYFILILEIHAGIDQVELLSTQCSAPICLL